MSSAHAESKAASFSPVCDDVIPNRLYTECFRSSARRLASRALEEHIQTERWNLDNAKRAVDDFAVVWLSRSCAVLRAEMRRRDGVWHSVRQARQPSGRATALKHAPVRDGS
jgi:hypothetical protein